MLTDTAAPSPQLFFDTAQAYQRTAALRAAIELDLFTAIGDGAETVPAIAAQCEASERGTRILCDYLTIIGFLTKTDGRYQLTLDSGVFLSKRSPAYFGSVIGFLGARRRHPPSSTISRARSGAARCRRLTARWRTRIRSGRSLPARWFR